MKKMLFLTFSLIGLALTHSAPAAGLLQVYQDALHSDPSYKAAEAQFLSTKEGVPQQLATLLPQLALTGSGAYNRTYANAVSASTGVSSSANSHSKNRNYTLTLTQKLFDFSNFKSLDAAKATAKSAAATYAEASQSLIQRSAQSYFSVLQSEDIVLFSVAKEKALKRQYEQAQQRYKVGLDTITDVYEAQASYEAAVANTIADRNRVVDAKEDLHKITNKYYDHLDRVSNLSHLKHPQPNNVGAWAKNALSHNFTLIADRYTSVAARSKIKQEFGGHLPTLNFTGSYADTYTAYTGAAPAARNRQTVGELDLAFPLFSGGAVNSEVRQARYDYENSLDTQEQDMRTVNAQTRQDYNGIIASISQINADKRAVRASQSALKGASAEFEVGTKTMLDVLTQQENLFNAQSTQAKDLYAYINGMIKLAEDAGKLSYDDIKEVNGWLTSRKNSWIHANPTKAHNNKHKAASRHSHKAHRVVKHRHHHTISASNAKTHSTKHHHSSHSAHGQHKHSPKHHQATPKKTSPKATQSPHAHATTAASHHTNP